ncbi:Delta(24)-sterol C-methyltransferase [Massospora cicadina]|nr:Delta(24)-sterol C-methyltransferase [Massospora cicadina]
MLHGNADLKTSFVNKVVSKDKRLAEEQYESYRNFWDERRTGEEEEVKLIDRQQNYSKLVNAYYNLSTDLYEYGWGTSFHFARMYKGEPLKQSIARHQHYLALQLQLKPNMKVLDVGCGVGGPAREMIQFTKAHVTGLNNNAYQLDRASRYAAAAMISHKAPFIKGDFMNMDIPDNSYDAVYAIEATCHAPTLEGVYKEIFRVVKPGGRVALYEWCLTDTYDCSNATHKRISLGIEEGDGIAKLYTTEEALAAFKNAGFEVETSADLAITEGSDIPWYIPLEGRIQDGITGFFRTKLGKLITRQFVGVLETVGLAPKGTQHMSQVLSVAQDNLIEGAKLGIFTPMFLLVGRKPQN